MLGMRDWPGQGRAWHIASSHPLSSKQLLVPLEAFSDIYLKKPSSEEASDTHKH